jgi:hypothetical protein
MVVAGAPDAVALKLEKAAEFLLMAEFALEGGCFDAATSLAVTSGINSGDVLCLSRLKALPSGQDHGDTVRILRKNGFDQASMLLGRLLGVKSKAQYSLGRCTRGDAEAAVKRADRILVAVRILISKGKE